MFTEATYLFLSGLLGCSLAWTAMQYSAVHLDPTRSSTSTLPLWAIIAAVPLFIKVLGRYHEARMRRIEGCSAPPHYPHREPIFGLDALLRIREAQKHSRLLELLDGWFREFGNTFAFTDMGKRQLITCDVDNIKTILATNFDGWVIGGPRQKLMNLVIGPHAIFAINGEEWSHSRKMIRPTFTRDQVADLQCADRHVDNLLARIPHDGQTVDLQELFYLFTMDLSTDFMFGYSTNTLSEPAPDAKEFLECFDYAMYNVTARARMSRLALLIPDRRFDRSVTTCSHFIDRYIAKATASRREKERPYVFLAELMNAGVSPETQRHQLLSMILGGRDTSASVLSAIFWTLARRPDVTQKLTEEIATLRGRRPSWEDLKGLTYLNMVVKEALRLFPPVVTNQRLAARDTLLPKGGGADGQSPVFVRRGTSCRWLTWSLHRQRDLWGDDARDFCPERWEGLRTSWHYLPFSGGPRICPGQQFAQTIMLYTITRIFQEFRGVEARDDLPMQQRIGATASLVHGAHVGFEAAQQATLAAA